MRQIVAKFVDRLNGEIETLMMIEAAGIKEHELLVVIISATVTDAGEERTIRRVHEHRAPSLWDRALGDYVKPKVIGDDDVVSEMRTEPLFEQECTRDP